MRRKSIYKMLSICILSGIMLAASTPSHAQEMEFIAHDTEYYIYDYYPDHKTQRNTYLYQCYPNCLECNDESRKISSGDTVTFYAYRKYKRKVDYIIGPNGLPVHAKYIGYFHSPSKMGCVCLSTANDDLTTMLLSSDIPHSKEDWKEGGRVAKLTIKYKCEIDAYYVAQEKARQRAEFVKDSLEKRQQYVKDSLERRQRYIDSLTIVEKSRADSIKAVQQAEEAKARKLEHDAKLVDIIKQLDPIIINIKSWSISTRSPMCITINVRNCSAKIIKYITFKGRFRNSVNDLVRELRTGGYTWEAKCIGPIQPAPKTVEELHLYSDYDGSYRCEHLQYFYPQTATNIELTSVTIDYMDGSHKVLTGKALEERYDTLY